MSWIHTHLVLPLAEPERHRGLAARLRKLEQFERLSADEQRAQHAEKIRRILLHAYRTTPYYRRVIDEVGLRPEEWSMGQTLPVPLLTREMLRENEDSLWSRQFSMNQLRSARTGGTTGPPVRFWRDIRGLREKTALKLHLEIKAGYAPGDPVLMIWGAARDLTVNPNWKWRLYEQTIMRQYAAPVGELSDEVFERFYEKLNSLRPKVIFGYTVSIARFAEYVLKRGGKHHSPSAIIVTAEPLLEEDGRIIEAAFGIKATNFYGSRDFGMVASECSEHNGVHFHPAGCFVEFLYEGMSPEGPIHRLVVTDLLNYGSPLLRYDTSDCVILDNTPCACGSWYPRVRQVLGRTADNFTLADGTKVPGVIVFTKMATMKSMLTKITGVQLIQKDYDLMELKYTASGDEEAIQNDVRIFCSEIGSLFPHGLRWIHTRVPEILRESSGKMRLCISEVKSGRAVELSHHVG